MKIQICEQIKVDDMFEDSIFWFTPDDYGERDKVIIDA
jgi:hypothetical protein